jgi:hypothetical protein
MSEDDAIQAMRKQPKKRGGVAYIDRLYYDTANLVFFSHYQSRSSFALTRIEIQNRTSPTREGIRIGALLSDVIRVYGDSVDNQHFIASAGHIATCLVVDIRVAPRRTEILSLRYLDRGVEFEVSPLGAPSVATTVDEIDVIQPVERSECPSLQ